MLTATTGLANAQTVTPDLFSPNRQSQVITQDSPLRRTTADAVDPLNGLRLPDADPSRRASSSATTPERVGQIPTYGLPAANGASTSGYDSLNRKRLKPKYYPGQAKPKPPPGPGSPVPTPPPLTAAG
ncbi:membrane protein, partial [Bradyrhizobium sp. NAS96.2]